LPRSSQVYSRHDAHARPELKVVILTGIEDDLNGNPLDDLDEVACCVFRRQYAEQWSSGAADAVDVAPVGAAIRVHPHINNWTWAHMLELSFFEVRRNPDVLERHHSQQLLAGLHIHSNDDALVYYSADRRGNARVSQIQFRLSERSSFLLNIG